jgi:hypothetical protein
MVLADLSYDFYLKYCVVLISLRNAERSTICACWTVCMQTSTNSTFSSNRTLSQFGPDDSEYRFSSVYTLDGGTYQRQPSHDPASQAVGLPPANCSEVIVCRQRRLLSHTRGRGKVQSDIQILHLDPGREVPFRIAREIWVGELLDVRCPSIFVLE